MKKTVFVALAFSLLVAPPPITASDGRWKWLVSPITWPAGQLIKPFRGGKVVKCSKKGDMPVVVVSKKTFRRFGPAACGLYGEVAVMTKGRIPKAINAEPGKQLRITKKGTVL